MIDLMKPDPEKARHDKFAFAKQRTPQWCV